ncbi:MAG: flagellar biosynthetic protein FliR [Rhodobacteraceae bacterium]|nr:flagellar biosynthetic protein FliR [Paracoccaceae bacterium]
MMAELAALAPFAGRELLAAALVFLRVAGAVSVFPAFGETAVPLRIRLAIAVALTMAVAPAVGGIADEAAATAGLAWQEAAPRPGQGIDAGPGTGGERPGGGGPAAALALVLTEVAIGLAFGLTLRLFVQALATAGAMIAQATGLSQLFGAGGNEPTAAVAQLLVLGGVTLALSAGLHVQAAAALIWTYAAFPPGRPPDPSLLADWHLETLAAGFVLAFRMAAPFLVAGLVWNLALGAVNRAMPQILATLAGAPATMAGALVLLLLLLPEGLRLWTDAFAAFLAAPAEIPP